MKAGEAPLPYNLQGMLRSGLAVCFVAAVCVVPTPIAGAGSSCGGRAATIVGTSGKDRLSGTTGSDVIDGKGGNDRIRSFGGNDILCGGAGHDELDAGSGEDLLLGGGGNDSIFGGGGNDTSVGGKGRFDLAGSPFSRHRISASLATGISRGEGTDRIRSAEGLIGSYLDDHLRGNEADNSLLGGDGHDVMKGGGGDDLLLGWLGDDVYNGGEGNQDIASFYLASGVEASLTAGEAESEGFDSLLNVEGLEGSRAADGLGGDRQRNILLGHKGEDRIRAEGGKDLVVAGPDRHVRPYYSEDDAVFGGAGSDRIFSGWGFDDIEGGGGPRPHLLREAGGRDLRRWRRRLHHRGSEWGVHHRQPGR